MVLTASETIEIENIKHAHELQILNRKEEISKEEHKRDMEKFAMQKEIAILGSKADDRLVNALTEIHAEILYIRKYGLTVFVGKVQ